MTHAGGGERRVRGLAATTVSAEWTGLQERFLWPDQELYELIRPVVLFEQPRKDGRARPASPPAPSRALSTVSCSATSPKKRCPLIRQTRHEIGFLQCSAEFVENERRDAELEATLFGGAAQEGERILRGNRERGKNGRVKDGAHAARAAASHPVPSLALALLLALSGSLGGFSSALSAHLLHHPVHFIEELLGRGIFEKPLQLLWRDNIAHDLGVVALNGQGVTGC